MAKKPHRHRRRLGQIETVAYTTLRCTPENQSKLMTVIYEVIDTTCTMKFPVCEGGYLNVKANCATPGSAKLFKNSVERIARLIQEAKG